MDPDSLRRHMVERDLVGRGISDPAVLAAIGRVPRHLFVEGHDAHTSYGDHPLPIGEDQTISQPYIVGLMAELLALEGRERVLDVGTGSGYGAAVLSELGDQVWSIERHATLAASSAARLARLGYDRVHVVTGDGSEGWPDEAPFDAICVAASAADVPPALIDQLADDGRLVIPLDRPGGVQELVVVERHGDDLSRREVMPVRFVPLVTDH